MDKSWMSSTNCRSKEYLNGVNDFIEFAKQNMGDEGTIPCPCRHCMNSKWGTLREVKSHLKYPGIDKSYTFWVHHGETLDSDEDNDDKDDDLENDINEHYNIDEQDEVQQMLEDMQRGTILETRPISPECIPEVHATQDDNVGRFNRLVKDAERELYPGCKLSLLSSLLKLLHVKVLNRWSNKSWNMLVDVLKEMLPEGDRFPINYYEARKVLDDIGLGCVRIHACKNDCVLYWKEHKDKQECPVCLESRWKINDGKRQIPHKILRHFPLKPRLQRLYMSKQTASDMKWHKEKHVVEENIMRHPSDSEAWKHLDRQFPWFAEDPRNVRLGLATDGFNPFGNMSNSHSTWPVIVMPYNLPPWQCMKDEFFVMSLLIPGPRSPGKDICVYMRPLIDELKELWTTGIKTMDASTGEYFTLYAAVLWTINDFPAYGDLSGWRTKGYKACPNCGDQTCSHRLRDKLCYTDHRIFLPKDHKWRKSLKFNGKHERRLKPIELCGDEILAQIQPLKNIKFGKHPETKKRKRAPEEGNWKKMSILFELPYWKVLKVRHNIDVMHTLKNIFENLFGTMLNIEGKTKDTYKARLDLQDMNIRPELHLQLKNGKYVKPTANYTLSGKERKEFFEFLKSIRFPDSFASNISRCVNLDNYKVSGLKSHDCYVLLQRILPIGIRGYLNKDIHNVVIELAGFFRNLCSRTLRMDILRELEKQIVLVLCKLEMIFPPAFFDVMLHLAVHLPHEALLAGPVQYRWMFPIERNLCRLKAMVRNRARPEGSIAEAYIVDECLIFYSKYLQGIETRFNRVERYYDGENPCEGRISIFSHKVRPFAKSNYVTLEEEEYNLLHWYVLNNCEESKPYLDEYEEELIAKNPTLTSQDILIMQKKTFPSWFEKRIGNLCKQGILQDTDDIYSLALGPDKRIGVYSGCIVNGIKFLNKRRDARRVTQNSGVCVEGFHKDKDIIFYGILSEVIELTYVNNNCQVVLFKCEWFDLDKFKPVPLDNHFTSINVSRKWYESDPYILATQATQVFYVQDTKLRGDWHVVQKVHHRHLFDPSLFSASEDNLLDDRQPIHVDAYQQDESFNTQVVEEIGDPGSLIRKDVDDEFVDVDDDEVRQKPEHLIFQKNKECEIQREEDDDSEDDDTLDDYFEENEIDLDKISDSDME